MLCKQKDLKPVREWGMLLLPFFQCLILLRLSPMMYDGWAGSSYYRQHGGLLNWPMYVIGLFRDWVNGRVGSNLICGLLESLSSEWLLDVVGALLLTAIPACLILLFHPKNRTMLVFTYSSLLALAPYGLRTYVIQIALAQYVAPIVFLLLALVLLDCYEKNNKAVYVWWLYPITIFACTWMENSSVAYGAVLALCVFRICRQQRRIDWKLMGVLICGLCAGLFMVTAPGMRMSRIDAAGGASVFWGINMERTRAHLTKLLESLLNQGAMLNLEIGMLFFVLSAAKLRKKTRSKFKIAYIILMIANAGMIVLFAWLGWRNGEFIYTSEISKSYLYFVSGTYVRLALVTGGYSVWLIVNTILLAGTGRHIVEMLLFAAVCFLSVLPTTQVADRIYSPIFFIIVCLVCVAVAEVHPDSIVPRRLIWIAVGCCVLLAADYEVQLYSRLYEVGHERAEKLETLALAQYMGEDDPDRYYVLPAYNERDAHLGGVAAMGSFHYPQFLAHYGLRQGSKIVFSAADATEILSLDVTDMWRPVVHIIELNSGNFSYDFTVSVRHQPYEPFTAVIYETDITDTEWSFDAVGGAGEYQIVATKHDLDSGATWIVDQTLLVTVG